MLRAHCPRHGGPVLITTGRITSIDNTDRAVVAHWRCTCGHRGTTSFPRRPLP